MKWYWSSRVRCGTKWRRFWPAASDLHRYRLVCVRDDFSPSVRHPGLQWRALDTVNKSTASPGAETDVKGKGLSVQILTVTLCSGFSRPLFPE
jgi:hypothetical protein